MPKVVDKNTNKVVESMDYSDAGASAAEELAATNPDLKVVHQKHPLQGYAHGGAVGTRVATRGSGAARRGNTHIDGCSSRPRR